MSEPERPQLSVVIPTREGLSEVAAALEIGMLAGPGRSPQLVA